MIVSYSGEFLAAREDAWLLPYRERLRNKFLHCALAVGEQFEQRGEWRAACDHYERMLEHAPTSEALYRQLAYSHLQLGEQGEALTVFKRCRAMLEENFGVAPGFSLIQLVEKGQK